MPLIPGRRDNPLMIAARVLGWRSSHQPPAMVAAAVSRAAVALARRNSLILMKVPSVVSDLLPKSCSTDENCGSTNRMKNSMTPPAATSTKAGYCIASVSLRRINSDRAPPPPPGPAPAGPRGPGLAAPGPHPPDIGLAGQQFESIVETRSRLQQQRH